MRRTVIAVSIIVVLTVAGTIFLQRRGYLPVASPVDHTPDVVLQLENVRIVGRSRGQKTWSANAKRVEVSRSRINTQIYDIHDGVIYDQGKPAAKLKAGHAVYNEIDRSIEANGGVDVVTGNKGNKINISTSGARYDSWSDKLICPTKVKLKTKRSTAEADSIVADVKTNEIHAKHLRMRIDLGELEEMMEKQESSSSNRGRQ